MDLERHIDAQLSGGDLSGAARMAIEGYGPSIFGYLCGLVGEDDARDVFSQFAEDLWRGLPGFRRECSLRAWACRLASNAAARFRRDPFRARGTHLATSAASRLAASVAASTVLPGGRRDLLRRLRESLTEEDRTLLVLRIEKELEWEEIAAVLSTADRPVTAVALRKRFERIKLRLKRQARDAGLLD